jgi:hypothetical protein
MIEDAAGFVMNDARRTWIAAAENPDRGLGRGRY